MKKIFKGFFSVKRVIAIGVVVLAAGFSRTEARADTVIYQFDNSFSGGTPAGSLPWVVATLQDTSGGVLLTVNNSGLTAGEFLGSLYLNINPADSLQIPNLTFTLQGSSAGVVAPTIQTGEDGFKADGDGKYDILFSFATANTGVFGAGDQISYLISGIPGLTADDFICLSTPAGGNGPFDAAGHIQGIPPGGDSAWIDPSQGAIIIPVPEPSPAAILTLALGLLGGTRLWLRRARA